MSARSVNVSVRYSGNTYLARAGRGKAAKTASCTSSDLGAVQAAAAKFFGLDASNTVKPVDLLVEFLTVSGEDTVHKTSHYHVALPAPKGGAA